MAKAVSAKEREQRAQETLDEFEKAFGHGLEQARLEHEGATPKPPVEGQYIEEVLDDSDGPTSEQSTSGDKSTIDKYLARDYDERRRELEAQIRRETPGISDEQVEARIGLVEATLGV